MMVSRHRLPALDPSKNVCHSPHVVLLGAGASLAALPEGDAAGKRLPTMNNFVEVVGLESILDESGMNWKGRDFEQVFSGLMQAGGGDPLVKRIERAIYDYFADLQLPETVTLYDELLLSLRNKDLVATFNWDPFLLQAYRRNLCVKRLPQILFLHGNVGVGACNNDRCKGPVHEPCMKCGEPLEPVRLLYPVTEKNYNDDPFIKGEWEIFSAHLEHAYLLTIFGYSAPVADVEAQRIMRDIWASNLTRELAQISIVDIKDPEEIRGTWEAFFVRDHYGISSSLDHSQLFNHPRRSCDAFAMASLQQQPCHDNPLPRGSSLAELHEFVAPLVAEEEALESDGAPFNC
ncbi:hypothetical protein ACFL4Y_00180 [Gemmatimonadota bacterium]